MLTINISAARSTLKCLMNCHFRGTSCLHMVSHPSEKLISPFVAHIFHITSWKQPIFNSQCHIDVSGFQNVHSEIVHIGYGQRLDIAVFNLSFRLITTVLPPVTTFAGCKCPSLSAGHILYYHYSWKYSYTLLV
jgi:hypothetical protein